MHAGKTKSAHGNSDPADGDDMLILGSRNDPEEIDIFGSLGPAYACAFSAADLIEDISTQLNT